MTSWVVPGLIPAGLSVLEGRWNEGTSSVALSVLLATAAGGRALGKIPAGEPREVLYVALRDSDVPMEAQCREIIGTAPIPERFSYMTAVRPGMVAAALNSWISATPGTVLVIIDSLAKLIGPMGRTDSPMKLIGEQLREVVEAHEGIAVVAMCPRTVGGVTQDTLGASATIAFDRYTATSAKIKVTGTDLPEREYPLVRDLVAGGGWTVEGSYPGPAADDFPSWEQEIGAEFSIGYVRNIDGNGNDGWQIKVDPVVDRAIAARYIAEITECLYRWYTISYPPSLSS